MKHLSGISFQHISFPLYQKCESSTTIENVQSVCRENEYDSNSRFKKCRKHIKVLGTFELYYFLYAYMTQKKRWVWTMKPYNGKEINIYMTMTQSL